MEAHFFKLDDDPVSLRATASGTDKTTGVVWDTKAKKFKYDADLLSAARHGNKDWKEHEVGPHEAMSLVSELGGSWSQLINMLSTVDQ